MCTVTYLPLQNNNFILTSNRDEGIGRKSIEAPKVYKKGKKELIYPKDMQGGSWIGISKETRIICLLNGAFEPHKRHFPYRKSRGLVVLDALAADSGNAFLRNCNLEEIEPFTLIMVDWEDVFFLKELLWDGTHRYIRALDPKQPAIWSSVPLYDPTMRAKREQWFKAWQEKQSNYEVNAIRKFHKTAGEGDPFSNLITERVFLQTLSITSIHKSSTSTQMMYEDRASGQVSTIGFASNLSVH